MAENPKLPDGTWAVNKEDKELIVDLGRELTKFILNYAKAKGETFHTKIVAGSFQYFMELQNQKAKLVGDDVLITQAALEQYGLGNKIDEPFTEPEPAPTPVAEVEKVAADDAAKKDADVEDASIAPSNVPVSVDRSEETA